MPFITLLKERLDVLELRSPTDYRLARLKAMRVYHAPLGTTSTRALERAYADLTEGVETTSETVSVKGRVLPVRRTARGVAWFGFDELCARPLGAEDYIRIAERYHTKILDGVPRLKEIGRAHVRTPVTNTPL